MVPLFRNTGPRSSTPDSLGVKWSRLGMGGLGRMYVRKLWLVWELGVDRREMGRELDIQGQVG